MAYYSSPNIRFSHKPIGAYLVEAGLLSEAQVGVALVDQQNVGSMSFGEILVTRGWVKEQTIEYLMQKVIVPERIAEKSSFSDLESNLIRQKPKSTYIPGVGKDSDQDLQSVASKEKLAQKKEEGVNWIG
jgi:predicted CopG family antitoxin